MQYPVCLLIAFLTITSPLFAHEALLNDQPSAPSLANNSRPLALSILGDRDYAPYAYVQDETAKGLYVDILEKAFSRLRGYHIELKMVPWKRGLAMVEEGNKFAIFPPYYWPQKRPYISKYSEAIYQEQVVTICNRHNVPKAQRQWPTDYQELRIGTNRGFLAPGPAFFKLVEQQKITLVHTKNSDTALRMLMLKRIDCYVNSKLVIDWRLKSFRKSDIYGDLTERLYYSSVISQSNAHIGYSKAYLARHPEYRDFIEQLDHILLEMKRTGEIDNILNRFLHLN